jgi:hypothetical protein
MRGRMEVELHPTGRSGVMAGQVVLNEDEVRAFASLLSRVSERLDAYENQTHQDRRHAEELQATADDLLRRLEEAGTPAS